MPRIGTDRVSLHPELVPPQPSVCIQRPASFVFFPVMSPFPAFSRSLSCLGLAAQPEFARTKVELAKWLPTHNAPHNGAGTADAGDEPAATKKKVKQKAAR